VVFVTLSVLSSVVNVPLLVSGPSTRIHPSPVSVPSFTNSVLDRVPSCVIVPEFVSFFVVIAPVLVIVPEFVRSLSNSKVRLFSIAPELRKAVIDLNVSIFKMVDLKARLCAGPGGGEREAGSDKERAARGGLDECQTLVPLNAAVEAALGNDGLARRQTPQGIS
jgi:hypothetical protein